MSLKVGSLLALIAMLSTVQVQGAVSKATVPSKKDMKLSALAVTAPTFEIEKAWDSYEAEPLEKIRVSLDQIKQFYGKSRQ
jgi:hypothetical protein